MRQTPDFLFIGGARCASTWLHECLKEHPDICVPQRPKELNFFNRDTKFSLGLPWYAGFWKHCGEGQIRGEVTPTYLCHEPSAARIHGLCPDVKLIACLRNPIDRTYSAYRGHVLTGRVEQGMTVRQASDILKFDNQSSLIEHSHYHRHLTRFFELIPRERCLVYLYDEVKTRPADVVRRVYKFLGADESFVPDTLKRAVNSGFQMGSVGGALIRKLNQVGRTCKSVAPRMHGVFEMGVRLLRNRIVSSESTCVPPDIVSELIPIYREENDRLAALLDIDLSHWNQGADA